MARGAALTRLAVVAASGCVLLAGGLQVTAVQHTVMALAAYSDMADVSQFNLHFLNTLRGVGFEGNIFLGMWEGTKDATRYLERYRVTPKYIRRADCQLPYKEEGNNYITRNVCTEDFPHIKLDNARWIYGRRWLEKCSTCDGWVMYADFGDINFQRNPFAVLPDVGSVPPETVYLTEEMRPRLDRFRRHRGITTSNWLVRTAVMVCYGPAKGLNISRKPMINIASTFGTRAGMLRWLGRLEQEFQNISSNKKCDPVKICDQGVLNHLFYNEGAMPYATPKEYGKWIVNTMGVPCSNELGFQPEHSLDDIAIIDGAGRVWNEDGTLPAVIHQGKVCWNNYVVPHLWPQFSGTENVSHYRDALRIMKNATFPGSSRFPGRRSAVFAVKHNRTPPRDTVFRFESASPLKRTSSRGSSSGGNAVFHG